MLTFRHRSLAAELRPHLMGIVNVTPDSFYDNGATASPASAIARALAVVEAGASVIDVGGMTARPGLVLSERDELARVLPVIAGVREAGCQAVVSVDTYRAEVAAAVLDAGADLINDHTGLSDGDLAAAVAERRGGLVVTHLGLGPKQVQGGRYQIDPATIAEFLVERAQQAAAAGVARDAIVVDPGLGFGKSTETDLATLRALPQLLDLGYPLLLACSHKEVTAEPLGLPESSIEGTAAVVAIAAYLGVQMLRVHDLPFMAHVARMGSLMSPAAGARRDQTAGGARSGANSGKNRPSR
ncbi:MAG: dihydropteroate synthase [Gaiellales bacterium]|jgi:dihydropteroate synthase|nr:dihydropteroate synthase [Gaiellales bacterium]MDX6544723.1 dihydropteroate synthase [Gaiellales bacterium]